MSVDNQQVEDFIRNTGGAPAHLLPKDKRNRADAMERPADVKLGPDGALYVLDMGRVDIKNGREHPFPGTARVYRLAATELPAATQSAGESQAGEFPVQ